MIETGPPAPQADSRLLGLPAELRNKVYEFAFDDGKPANVKILFSCRQIYTEGNRIFYASVIPHIRNDKWGDIDWWNVEPSNLPPSILCSLKLVIFEDYHTWCNACHMPRYLHRWGLYAIFTIHERRGNAAVPAPRGRGFVEVAKRDFDQVLKISDYEFKCLLALARRDSVRGTDGARSIGIGIIAQFLDNPLLRKWKFRHFEAGTLLFEMTGVREVEDGSPLPAPSPATTPLAESRNLEDEAWLYKTKIDVVEECGDDEIVVAITHEDLDDVARVRYKYIRHHPTGVESLT